MATAKSRKERVEIARSRDILSVADELGMELVRTGQDFRWKEHDSLVITPKKNVWKWFSRDQGGDVIALVETMKEINFNQAIDYLNDGDFKVYDASQKLETQEPFSYYLQRYEQPFDEARTYLKAERGLTDETIDFFLDKGVLAQANAKLGDSIEPVIVFKTLSSSGEVVGGNLQGIRENWDKWPKRGYAKNIIRNSEEMNGLHIDIGQPTRLVFTESPIDLMSYYQLHKDTLDNVRLVSMDGLKEVSISRHLVQLEAELQGRSFEINDSTGEALENLARMTDYFQGGKHAEMITLAVDQDEHGLEFIQKLQEKGITVKPDLPNLQPGRDKTDWNDYLKFQNEPKNDNSRLAQARRKLDRLNNEFLDATDAVYNLSAMTNGQPMNDKRDGPSFFKKMDQLENRVFDKLDEIRQQEARVERLEAREERKAAGLNRSGNGLEMSVQNIPRIREEIEKAKRGESTYRSETIRRYQEELQRLEGISEKMSSLTIQPGAQALINDGTVNQWAKQPNIYFVKGLRRVAVELSDDGNFIESSKYRPKTPEERERLMQILKSQVSTSPAEPELRVVFDFTENLTIGKHYSKGDNIPYKDFVNILYQENTLQSFRAEGGYDKTYFDLQNEAGEILVKNIRFDVGSERETLAKQLETVLPEKYLELAQNAEIPEKQEESKKAPDQNQERLIDRTSGGTGSLQLEAEVSPTPVLETSTFEQTVTSHPTSSYPYLHFSTNYDKVQRRVGNYHPITPADLRRINQYAPSIQSTASWYLSELAGSRISFVYADHGEENVLQVSFQKENFIHLSGIRPFEEGKGAADFLEDFAAGQGHYDSILISNAIKDKLQVLPMLQDILEPQSFVLGDLSSVEKLHNLNMSEAIKAKDEDFLLLFKDAEGEKIPASLMKLRGELAANVKSLDEKVILGVYRERDGHLEQLSINEDYIKDGGKEIMAILKNRQYEPVEAVQENTLSSAEEYSHKAYEAKENQTNSAKKEVKNSIAQRVSEILSATNEKPENREELPQSVPSAEKENKATNLPNENNSFDYYKASAQDLSDQAIQKIRDYMRSPEELKEYMDFMSKFPNLSPRNIALIREQWPGADAVATFEQWRQIGRSLGITPDDVIPVEATFENKRTGNKKEISNDQLSVKFGERSKITLFRPAMIEMIPVFNEQGYQVINEKGNPKFKPKSQASPEERKKIKNKEIKVVEFQERDQNGRPKFNPYKVFELSQTNLKPEAYPKAIPNRHYNFNLDKVRTKEVLAGLNDYARKIQVSIAWNEERFIGNSKGVFLPIEQKIILNKSNTPGENISTAIHELAHATLHNPQKDYKKELSQDRKELEAELTSYLVSKHFGLDTSQKSIVYMAAWTDNLKELSDSDLSQSLTRIHKTTAKIIESVERHTTPFQPNHQLRLNPSGPEFSQFPPSRGMKI